MPWPEVGKHVGLTAKQARAEGIRALDKLRRLFEAGGMDEEYVRGLAHDKEKIVETTIVSIADDQ